MTGLDDRDRHLLLIGRTGSGKVVGHLGSMSLAPSGDPSPSGSPVTDKASGMSLRCAGLVPRDVGKVLVVDTKGQCPTAGQVSRNTWDAIVGLFARTGVDVAQAGSRQRRGKRRRWGDRER